MGFRGGCCLVGRVFIGYLVLAKAAEAGWRRPVPEGLRCWEQESDGVEWRPEQQLGKQPDEAMSSSRGDARAAKRARTGGAKIAL
jgi:hypothetical protein